MNALYRRTILFNHCDLKKRFIQYVQGQEPEPKIREYFYYIDHQGMVSKKVTFEPGM